MSREKSLMFEKRDVVVRPAHYNAMGNIPGNQRVKVLFHKQDNKVAYDGYPMDTRSPLFEEMIAGSSGITISADYELKLIGNEVTAESIVILSLYK